MKVVWSDPAVEDLESIHAYIAHDSAYYARRFVAQILDAVESLRSLPHRGRRVPEARDIEEVREVLFRSYRIIYRAQPEHVEVLAIIHGSRDLSRIEPSPWDLG